MRLPGSSIVVLVRLGYDSLTLGPQYGFGSNTISIESSSWIQCLIVQVLVNLCFLWEHDWPKHVCPLPLVYQASVVITGLRPKYGNLFPVGLPSLSDAVCNPSLVMVSCRYFSCCPTWSRPGSSLQGSLSPRLAFRVRSSMKSYASGAKAYEFGPRHL